MTAMMPMPRSAIARGSETGPASENDPLPAAVAPMVEKRSAKEVIPPPNVAEVKVMLIVPPPAQLGEVEVRIRVGQHGR